MTCVVLFKVLEERAEVNEASGGKESSTGKTLATTLNCGQQSERERTSSDSLSCGKYEVEPILEEPTPPSGDDKEIAVDMASQCLGTQHTDCQVPSEQGRDLAAAASEADFSDAQFNTENEKFVRVRLHRYLFDSR